MKKSLVVASLIMLGVALDIARVEVASYLLARQFVDCVTVTGLDAWGIKACESVIVTDNPILTSLSKPLRLWKPAIQKEIKELAKSTR